MRWLLVTFAVVVFGMLNTLNAAAICFNPLELFCIFEAEAQPLIEPAARHATLINDTFADKISDADIVFNGNLSFTIKGSEYFRLVPQINVSGTVINLSRLSSVAPLSSSRIHSQKDRSAIKFAVNISKVPPLAFSTISGIIYTLESDVLNLSQVFWQMELNNITDDNGKKIGEEKIARIIFTNGFVLDLADWFSKDSSMEMNSEERTITQRNLTAFYDAIKQTFFADPTLQSSCGTLSTAGERYELTSNVTGNTDCFTVTAANIQIDGAGFNITFAEGGNGAAVDASTGVDGLRLENVSIYRTNNSNLPIGIDLAGSSYSSVRGVKIFFTGTNSAPIGIDIASTVIGTNITDNTITGPMYGIKMSGSAHANIRIENNSIDMIDASDPRGIDISTGSNVTIVNNRINVSASGAVGIESDPSVPANSWMNITGNQINGSGALAMIRITSSNNYVIARNLLQGSTQAIRLVNNVNNGTYEYNVINVTGNPEDTIEYVHGTNLGPQNNTFRYNNVTAEVTTNGILKITGVGGNQIKELNVFENNIIKATAAITTGSIIRITINSKYNTYANNTFISTNNAAKGMVNFTGRVLNYTFYNNIFNSSSNKYFGDANTSANGNALNTTIVNTPNIIGGANFSGNFWTNATSTGWSDNCTDANGDAFCDTTFTPFTNYIDYNPLAVPAAVSDTTSPTYSENFVNTSNPDVLDDVLFSSKWADEINLSQFIFSWNGTGLFCNTWANDSSAAFGADGWANVTKNIPVTCAVDNVKSIGFQFFANDTSNNKNQTSMLTIGNGAPDTNTNGTLNVTLHSSLNFNVTQNGTFSVNASIACRRGSCHQVNATVYYSWLGGAVNKRLNDTIKAIPLWNVTGAQNQTCATFLAQNQKCSVNWTINATGTGTYHNLTINFTSNNSFIIQNGTVPFRLNISEPTAAADSCTCTGDGNWEITNGDVCYLTTVCDTYPNIVRILNGRLRVTTGRLKAGGIYVDNSSGLFIDNNTGGFNITK